MHWVAWGGTALSAVGSESMSTSAGVAPGTPLSGPVTGAALGLSDSTTGLAVLSVFLVVSLGLLRYRWAGSRDGTAGRETNDRGSASVGTDGERDSADEVSEPDSPTADHDGPAAEPSSPTAEPSSPTAEPSSPTAEPSSPTAEPSSPTAEPGGPTAEHDGPTAEHDGPTADHDGPTADRDGSVAESGGPAADRTSPAADRDSPAADPRGPVVEPDGSTADRDSPATGDTHGHTSRPRAPADTPERSVDGSVSRNSHTPSADGVATNGNSHPVDGAVDPSEHIGSSSRVAATLEADSDEERVLGMLETNDGSVKQARIVEETDWSKSKVSTLLSEMAEDGTITKLRLGRENVIFLDGEEPELALSPDDERGPP